MGDIASLEYPNRSHRKKVILPEPSPELAEFFGIMIGDGGINNPWQANITLNAVKDFQYSVYVQDLIKRLFSVTPTSFKYKTRDALRILVNGVSIVDFLVSKGLSRGDKLKQGLSIPQWILERKEYKIRCIRGLIDTDGCLFIHAHTVAGKLYKNLGLTFFSKSPRLISQMAAIFEEFGIMPHITKRGTDIYLYRKAAIERYLSIFGTSNDRIRSVYQEFGGVG